MTFSEAVNGALAAGVVPEDFSLSLLGGVAGSLSTTVVPVPGSSTSYYLTVTGVTGNGAVQLNQVQDLGITDAATGLLPLTGTFYGHTYSILTLAPGMSFVAPTLVPTEVGDVDIAMSTPGKFYLVGNSSGTSLLLYFYGSQVLNEFPDGSMVYAWNGSGYSVATADSSSPTGWDGTPPVIAPDQAFWVVPSKPMDLVVPFVNATPTNVSYLLSNPNATVTDSNNNTDTLANAIQFDGWLVVYGWNQASQQWQSLGWNSTDAITGWQGDVFDNTTSLTLTVTFG